MLEDETGRGARAFHKNKLGGKFRACEQERHDVSCSYKGCDDGVLGL